MREDTAPRNSSDRKLCSNRWAVRETFQSILKEKVDSEIRGQVICVQMPMQSFTFFPGIQVGVWVLMHTDYLSSTLQYTPVIKLYKLQKYVFQHDKVWERKLVSVCFFEKDDSKLPRKRNVSSHCEEGKAFVEFVFIVEEYYH